MTNTPAAARNDGVTRRAIAEARIHVSAAQTMLSAMIRSFSPGVSDTPTRKST